jgi:hypothetical protein
MASINDVLINTVGLAWQKATEAASQVPTDSSADPAAISTALAKLQIAAGFAANTEQNVAKYFDKLQQAHAAVANAR